MKGFFFFFFFLVPNFVEQEFVIGYEFFFFLFVIVAAFCVGLHFVACACRIDFSCGAACPSFLNAAAVCFIFLQKKNVNKCTCGDIDGFCEHELLTFIHEKLSMGDMWNVWEQNARRLPAQWLAN